MKIAIQRASFALALAASLAGCLPRLHVAHLRPAVDGIVVENGKPIPGVALFLAKFPGTNRPCMEVGELIAVAPDGSFS